MKQVNQELLMQLSMQQPDYLQTQSVQQASIYSSSLQTGHPPKTEASLLLDDQPYTSKIHSFYEDLYLTDLKNDLNDLSQ